MSEAGFQNGVVNRFGSLPVLVPRLGQPTRGSAPRAMS